MDELQQFWIGVGGVLESASLASSEVRLSLSDGRVVEGVPDRPATVAVEEQLDETGMPHTVGVAGAAVEVQDVNEIALVRPPRPPDTVLRLVRTDPHLRPQRPDSG